MLPILRSLRVCYPIPSHDRAITFLPTLLKATGFIDVLRVDVVVEEFDI